MTKHETNHSSVLELNNNNQLTPEETAELAGEYLLQGFHCSESMILSLAKYYLGGADPSWVKMVSGMAGGIGGSHEEVCGVITGAINIIGLLYADPNPDDNDDAFQELCEGYLHEFERILGGKRCTDFREGLGYTGREPGKPCSIIIEKGTRLLIDYLSKHGAK